MGANSEAEDNMKARTADGKIGEVEVLPGPCLLNTPDGEFCAEAGMIVVRFTGEKPIVLNQSLFDLQFTELPE
jgi:hypothetical protein